MQPLVVRSSLEPAFKARLREALLKITEDLRFDPSASGFRGFAPVDYAHYALEATRLRACFD